jgi:succinylglutamic semialdehyde dehydrogenase
VPALLAGNTAVFKPSEYTPLLGQKTAELWQASGLPPGVLNLVQGGRDTGKMLADHPGLDGLFFTGSAAAGEALSRAFAGRPEKILALEMGGNNPLIVWDAADARAAAMLIVQSAYLTAGQRCTCARRLILKVGSAGDRVLQSLTDLLPQVRIGRYNRDPEPFMGPVISDAAAQTLLQAQADFQQRGGLPLVALKSIGPTLAMLSPGLMDVSEVNDRPDIELFGPFLQVIRVDDFAGALAEANNTAYGLAAGLLSDRADLYEQFSQGIRAGVITWNRATTGASGRLPFGGVGRSGNHRPAGYWATDYCTYPVASLESPVLAVPSQPLPGIGT